MEGRKRRKIREGRERRKIREGRKRRKIREGRKGVYVCLYACVDVCKGME